ncbi:MAG: flagellar basal body-associated protein FliL [Rhizobiales bacterium]|nr:flagellar basal body-associated protein FliL [Hyphomicrobiales bacterium]
MALKPKKPSAKAEAEVEDIEEGDEGEAEAAAKPKFKKPPLKLIIIAAAAFLVIGAGGTGAYLILGAAKASNDASAAQIKPAVFLDLPDVLVNLSNSGSDRTQYLKVKVVLELPEQAMIQQVQPVMPRVMDAFQTYLRELRPTDLDGSAGLYRLKEELTRRVNAAVAPNRINAVLFKEIIVQ